LFGADPEGEKTDGPLVYTAAGAKHILEQQATDLEQPGQRQHHGFPRPARFLPRRAGAGDGLPTRAFVVNNTVGADFTPARCR
jgi:flagellar basal-body rod protein FlgF